jgi:hypothetical protein
MHAEFMSKPSQRRGHRRVYTTDREWVFWKMHSKEIYIAWLIDNKYARGGRLYHL